MPVFRSKRETMPPTEPNPEALDQIKSLFVGSGVAQPLSPPPTVIQSPRVIAPSPGAPEPWARVRVLLFGNEIGLGLLFVERRVNAIELRDGPFVRVIKHQHPLARFDRGVIVARLIRLLGGDQVFIDLRSSGRMVSIS